MSTSEHDKLVRLELLDTLLLIVKHLNTVDEVIELLNGLRHIKP